MDQDIDQRLRDLQREYLDFLEDEVSCTNSGISSVTIAFVGTTRKIF